MGSRDDASERVTFNAANLSYHYELHRDDWSDEITEEDYKRRALRLLTATRVQDSTGEILGFTRRRDGPGDSRGDFVRYDPETNEYATMTRDRVFKTLFRPLTGMDYYLDDFERYGGGHEATFTVTENGIQGAE